MSAGADAWFFAVALVASAVGGMLGMASGVFIVPILIAFGHVDIHTAIGASIVSVIACSCGGAAPFLKNGLTNIRIAIVLETATTLGAVCGALLFGLVPVQILYLLFAMIMLVSAQQMLVRRKETVARRRATPLPPLGRGWGWGSGRASRPADTQSGTPAPCPSPQGGGESHGSIESSFAFLEPVGGRWSKWRFESTYPDGLGRGVAYRVERMSMGWILMFGAGLISALLGIGSGVLKIPAMDTALRLPIKVSSATSNFMIGVTAAASAGTYFLRGEIDVRIAGPIVLGSMVGAVVGARLLARVSNDRLRVLFVLVLLALAVQMLLGAAGIKLGA